MWHSIHAYVSITGWCSSNTDHLPEGSWMENLTDRTLLWGGSSSWSNDCVKLHPNLHEYSPKFILASSIMIQAATLIADFIEICSMVSMNGKTLQAVANKNTNRSTFSTLMHKAHTSYLEKTWRQLLHYSHDSHIDFEARSGTMPCLSSPQSSISETWDQEMNSIRTLLHAGSPSQPRNPHCSQLNENLVEHYYHTTQHLFKL